MSTLRFARTCKTIVTRATKNEDVKGDTVTALKAEIEALRRHAQFGSDPEIERKVAENAEVLQRLEQSKQELVQQQSVQYEKRQQLLKDLGLSALTTTGIEQALQMDPNTPRLNNISDDPALSGCLCWYLLDGVHFRLGTDMSCKIRLDGLGVKAFMCSLVNVGHTKVMLSLLLPNGKP